jgi:predicted NBD/HSP70 family sugar kinase
VIAENDINALAVLTIHQIHYAVPDLVVVGVDDEGVGGGLVMDGRLRRGGNGRAMEIGHLSVGFPIGQDPYSPATGTRFKARCLCGQLGHVNTLAPPRRIAEAFGGGTLEQISQVSTRDPEFQRAQQAFKHGGAALGRALTHVSNTVNPSRIIMYLPAALAGPEPDTAATAYLAAVRQELSYAFAAPDQPDYLRIRSFPANPSDFALLGAQAAAVCVLESFIEHALRLDGCKAGSGRSTTSSQAPAR